MNVLIHSALITCVTLLSASNLDEGNSFTKTNGVILSSNSIQTSTAALNGSIVLQEGLLSPSFIYTALLQAGGETDIVWEVLGGSIISGQGTGQIEFITDPNPFLGTNNLSVSVYYRDLSGNNKHVGVTRNVAPGFGGTPISW